ncbi:T-box-containing protein TBX6L-like [Osmerus eperlanus]|uniref:T-box-containing protein TBX6L-like n=1 Tax=Osmerus eperlanus TaxID=29151 RepID=UPI002E0E019B
MTQAGPDGYQPGNIRMNLENSDLWKSFHDVGTEMIITKHGRRMFPHCNISLSGLQPNVKYVIMVEMILADNFRYKWNREQWEVGCKAEPLPPCRTYVHPDSPALGSHWMKQSVSFLKLKLTNHTLDQHGHIILHSMHRYYPRFHVIQPDSPYTVRWGNFQTFSFPETTFTAVTTYQNLKITKLKIDHNPFAKGFREDGTNMRSKRCRTTKSPKKDKKRAKYDSEVEYKSPPGLQRAVSDCEQAEGKLTLGAEEDGSSKGHGSAWFMPHSQSLHAEPLDVHGLDHSAEEQMVPSSMSYQPYRSVDYRLPSPSSSVAEDCKGCQSYECHAPDVATVPRDDTTRPVSIREHRPPTQATPSHDYRVSPEYRVSPSVDVPGPSKPSPGLLGYPHYGHYLTDQTMAGQGHGAQYRRPSLPHHHPLNPAEHAGHQHGYHHGNSAEWSQYSLFSYACW